MWVGTSDEIQVYNAEIAKIGQWTFQLHSNYAFMGRKEPDSPGGLIPNHALQGTGEWAYGITDWWEMGFYTPYAVDQTSIRSSTWDLDKTATRYSRRVPASRAISAKI